MRIELLKGSLCMSLTYQSTQLLNSLRIWTKHFKTKQGHNEIAKFYNSSMIGNLEKVLYVHFTNPIYQKKNVMWYTTFDQNHYKPPFISSHHFIKFFLHLLPLAPFLWICPHHNIKTNQKKILYYVFYSLILWKKLSIYISLQKKEKIFQ